MATSIPVLENKEELQRLIVTYGSVRNVARIIGCSHPTVYYACKKLQIELPERINRTIIKNCGLDSCAKEFKSYESRNRVFCSLHCARVAQHANDGRYTDYDGFSWSVRHAVWIRDGGRCRICGTDCTELANHGRRVGVVHHLNYQKNDAGDNNSNLVLLCRACHTRHHASNSWPIELPHHIFDGKPLVVVRHGGYVPHERDPKTYIKISILHDREALLAALEQYGNAASAAKELGVSLPGFLKGLQRTRIDYIPDVDHHIKPQEFTKEHRANLSKSRQGKAPTKGMKLNRVNGKGWHHTEEYKEMMRKRTPPNKNAKLRDPEYLRELLARSPNKKAAAKEAGVSIPTLYAALKEVEL